MTDEVIFGANMTTLNFALSRTAARDWERGRRDHRRPSSTTTRTSRPGSSSPTTRALTVHFCELDAECRLDLDHLRSLRLRAHAGRRVPVGIERGRHRHARQGDRRARPRGRRARLVRRGALRAARRHRDPRAPASTCCSARRTSSSGRTSGSRGPPRPARGLAPVQGAAASDAPGQRHETGTLPHELLCGFIATVEYLHGVGWKFITEHERKLGQRFLDGLPDGWTLHGPPTMEGRVSTFARHARPTRRPRRRRRGSAPPGSRSGTATTTPSRSSSTSGSRRRGAHRHRPHEHGGRGRPAARGAAAAVADATAWRGTTTRARRSGRSSAPSRAPRSWCSSRPGEPSSRRGFRR